MYGDQMVRMLRAVDMLCTATGVTKREMAERLEVDKRTVDPAPRGAAGPQLTVCAPKSTGAFWPVRNLLISIAV